MAGLVRKKITVRGRHKTFQRTVMVKTSRTKPTYMRGKSAKLRSGQGQMSLGQFMRKHGKKVAMATGAAALAGGAYLASKHRVRIGEHTTSASKHFAAFRRGSGAGLAKKLVSAAGERLASHAGESLGSRIGGGIGHMVGGRHGHAIGEMLGSTLGGVAASHLSERHIERAASVASKRVRESGYRRSGGRFAKP